MRWGIIIAFGIFCLGWIMVIADFLMKEPPCIDTYPPRACLMIIPWLTIIGIVAIVLGALFMVRIGTGRV